VAFRVSSRDELRKWEERLDSYHITYRPAVSSRTITGSTVIVFRDPDGIQLEIWADADEEAFRRARARVFDFVDRALHLLAVAPDAVRGAEHEERDADPQRGVLSHGSESSRPAP